MYSSTVYNALLIATTRAGDVSDVDALLERLRTDFALTETDDDDVGLLLKTPPNPVSASQQDVGADNIMTRSTAAAAARRHTVSTSGASTLTASSSQLGTSLLQQSTNLADSSLLGSSNVQQSSVTKPNQPVAVPGQSLDTTGQVLHQSLQLYESSQASAVDAGQTSSSLQAISVSAESHSATSGE
jgi:hypothetical protein